MAFETELRLKEEERVRKTVEKYEHSAYVEEVEGWPDSEETDKYLRDLKRLRHLMIHSKIGYGSQATGHLKASLRNKYPVACEACEEELGSRDQER